MTAGRPRSVHFPQGRHFGNWEVLALEENDLDGLRGWPRLDCQGYRRGLPHTAFPATTPTPGGLPEGRSCVRHVPERCPTPSAEAGKTPSSFRIEQPLGHRPSLIEEIESGGGPELVYGAGLSEEPKMGIDLFRRCLGDPPVVEPMPARSTVAFGEIGRN